MPDWTNATPTATAAGILRPEQLAQHVLTRRWSPGDALAPWVENYWALNWDLPDGTHFLSQTLPHPACNLTVERGSHPRPEVGSDPVVVTGVVTRRFEVDVRGQGWVMGVKFRPGGLAALCPARAADWTDRVVPARTIVPATICRTLAELDQQAEPEEWVREVEQVLTELPQRPDPTYDRLLTIVADMLGDRELVQVAQVEQRHGISSRTLQRWFTQYVGVGPKWVLARYRMHDVLTELDGGYDGPLTDLAYRYGWYDQAHFNRDFTSLVGVPPGQYRNRP